MSSFKVSECEIKILRAYLNEHEVWLQREASRPAHPIVISAMDWATKNETVNTLQACAQIISTLAVECPHLSQDGERVAYTNNAEAGAQNRHRVCKCGSYVKRIFGGMVPDHVVEKLVHKARNEGKIEFKVLPPAEIVAAMFETTATSCMTQHKENDWSKDTHPYRVFENPEHGWGLAVLINWEGKITDRALVNGKSWVRHYGTPTNGAYSVPSPTLEAKLDAQGFTKVSGWGRLFIERIARGDGIIGPYLDGDNTYCHRIDKNTIQIGRGDIHLEGTDGFACCDDEDRDGQVQDEDGDWIDEEDAVTLESGEVLHQYYATYIERHAGYYRNIQCTEDWRGVSQLRTDCRVIQHGEYQGEFALAQELTPLTDGHAAGSIVLKTEAATASNGAIVLCDELEDYEASIKQEEEAAS